MGTRVPQIHVVIVLEELNIPYDWRILDFTGVKSESYIKINPNGRLPAIQDPNAGITIWESGAIILYLIDEYDKDNKLSYKGAPEKYLTQQRVFFQVSGHGPYFGQAIWFARWHPEKIDSAIDRYVKEIDRVTGVLDLALTGRDWLVGDKCTCADLSFINWASAGKGLLVELGKADILEKYPNYARWIAAMGKRDVVKSVLERVDAGWAANNHPR
ncbi:uncharacterized protein Z518_03900 [Rhinocladiella mackenziei CBS 650.93]|uniref:Glutathione S-transferase n=1 Tax=Rhinocladiella mackenziei CBS 650.93 TaxID=1442369 RepID=A0A0D2IS15_9EURO|nr:uncharacterized protein Z518_03900 [Rhinocladiella mackenziei CBS 650.93]KIX05926.1 hypothetical protein Z518_03900 [Rhinocladiella mackenziei CBS 650.93]